MEYRDSDRTPMVVSSMSRKKFATPTPKFIMKQAPKPQSDVKVPKLRIGEMKSINS